MFTYGIVGSDIGTCEQPFAWMQACGKIVLLIRQDIKSGQEKSHHFLGAPLITKSL